MRRVSENLWWSVRLFRKCTTAEMLSLALEICRIFTEYLYWRIQLADCFQNRRFFVKRCLCKSSDQRLRTLTLVAQIVSCCVTCKRVSIIAHVCRCYFNVTFKKKQPTGKILSKLLGLKKLKLQLWRFIAYLRGTVDMYHSLQFFRNTQWWVSGVQWHV